MAIERHHNNIEFKSVVVLIWDRSHGKIPFLWEGFVGHTAMFLSETARDSSRMAEVSIPYDENYHSEASADTYTSLCPTGDKHFDFLSSDLSWHTLDQDKACEKAPPSRMYVFDGVFNFKKILAKRQEIRAQTLRYTASPSPESELYYNCIKGVQTLLLAGIDNTHFKRQITSQFRTRDVIYKYIFFILAAAAFGGGAGHYLGKFLKLSRMFYWLMSITGAGGSAWFYVNWLYQRHTVNQVSIQEVLRMGIVRIADFDALLQLIDGWVERSHGDRQIYSSIAYLDYIEQKGPEFEELIIQIKEGRAELEQKIRTQKLQERQQSITTGVFIRLDDESRPRTSASLPLAGSHRRQHAPPANATTTTTTQAQVATIPLHNSSPATTPRPTLAASGHPFRSLPLEFNSAQVALQAELVTACEEGDVVKVRELIAEGADLLTSNRGGKLPLGAAIWSCNTELVQLLDSLIGGELGPQAWQACAVSNTRSYGSLVPKIPPFDKRCSTFGDLHQWYQHHGGEGKGMYSDWYYKIAHVQKKEKWVRKITRLNESRIEVRERPPRKVPKWRDPKKKKGTQIVEVPVTGSAAKNIRSHSKGKQKCYAFQHDQFRQYAQAMESFVDMKITNAPIAQPDNRQTAPQGRDAFYQPPLQQQPAASGESAREGFYKM